MNPTSPLRTLKNRCHQLPRAVVDVVSHQATNQTSTKAPVYCVATISVQRYQSVLVLPPYFGDFGPTTSPNSPKSRSDAIFATLLNNSQPQSSITDKLPHHHHLIYQHKGSERYNPGLEAYLARTRPKTALEGHPAHFWTCSTLIFDAANELPSNHRTSIHLWTKPND